VPVLAGGLTVALEPGPRKPGGGPVDSGSVVDSGTGADPDSGTDSGTDSGADGGADSGADGGADSGTDSDADSGADSEDDFDSGQGHNLDEFLLLALPIIYNIHIN